MTMAYVEDMSGVRQYCRHPGQDEHACEILGIDYDLLVESLSGGPSSRENGEYRLPGGTVVTAREFEEFFMNRCGVMSGYLCLKCAKWSELDSHKDRMQCKTCGSGDLAQFEELGGKTCPFCGKGRMVSRMTGIS